MLVKEGFDPFVYISVNTQVNDLLQNMLSPNVVKRMIKISKNRKVVLPAMKAIMKAIQI